jgi:radical SAM superfamily enzyme YgiQ (UPF0313 family)
MGLGRFSHPLGDDCQKEDLLDQIQEAKRRGKAVAVGGPYPTALPHEAEAVGADYLILDEGEITLPLFVEAIARGASEGVFRSGGEKARCYPHTNSPLRSTGV